MQYRVHSTPWVKKVHHRVFVITSPSPNTDRFSKFFHWHTLRKISVASANLGTKRAFPYLTWNKDAMDCLEPVQKFTGFQRPGQIFWFRHSTLQTLPELFRPSPCTMASPGFGARGGLETESIFFWIGNHMESNVSLCGSEVTWKIKQLEVEGHVPQCPKAGDANDSA